MKTPFERGVIGPKAVHDVETTKDKYGRETVHFAAYGREMHTHLPSGYSWAKHSSYLELTPCIEGKCTAKRPEKKVVEPSKVSMAPKGRPLKAQVRFEDLLRGGQ